MDDLQLKLASMEGQLAGVASSLARMEEHLQRLVVLDRTVAEITVRQAHTGDALAHVRERIDENKNAHLANELALAKRIEETTRDSSRFENRMQGALYVVMSLLAVAATCGGWLLNQVNEMSKTTAVQEQRISGLERELTKLNEQKKIGLLYIPPKPL